MQIKAAIENVRAEIMIIAFITNYKIEGLDV
jgi:hypothetical protein